MSIKAVSWALELDIPDMAAKLVLVSLADHADGKTGDCFPTVESLSKHASASPRTVQRKIADLVRWGLVERLPNFEKGRQRANSYRLRLDRDGIAQDLDKGCQIDTLGEGDTCDTGEGDTPVTPEGVTAVTPLKDPLEETVITTQQNGLVEWIDFSEKYQPRQADDQIGMSRKAWKELADQDKIDAVMFAGRYCATQEKAGRKPLLSSEYLRQRAWRNLITAPIATIPVEWVEENSPRWAEVAEITGRKESAMRQQMICINGRQCYPYYPQRKSA